MNYKFKYTLLPITVFALTTGLSACFSESETSANNVEKSTKQTKKKAFTSKAERLATVEQDVEVMLDKMTLPEIVSLAHASGKFHINAIERVGIPEMWLSDGPHGVRHQIERHTWASAGWTDDQATYLPHLTSVAASWDVDMAALHGQVLGAEARDRKKDFILGPGVNLARLPLYGRTE